MSYRLFLNLVLTALLASAVYAQTPEEAEPEIPGKVPVTGIGFPLVSQHQGVFNDQSVAYTAAVSALDVDDGDGKPGARIVSTAYVRDPVDAGRPVIFLWNGGPISPSVYLHMGAFGPKRVAFSDDLQADPTQAPLADNPHSVLDVADLVFFDPAGTGFSRALPGKALEDYFSVEADAQQTAAFIARWLEVNGRSDSPAYILGESYGTNRAVEVAGQLARLEEPVLLDGVVLFGEAVNIIEYAQRPHNIISYVVSLPTLAAIAWYHGKAASGGEDLQGFVQSAWDYARTDYLEALFQGNTLPPEQMRAVAERLEAFSGLSADYYVENRLRVSKETYRVELFRAEDRIIGRADGRYVGPVKVEGAEEGAPPPDPAAGLPRALAAAFSGYLVSDLGAPSADQYATGSPVQGLNGWGWGGQSPFSRFDYGDAMDVVFEKNPALRVQVWAGLYDTMTTIGASWYLADQETWPSSQVAVKAYAGGHMAYSIDETVRQMAGDLREFVSEKP